MKTLYMELTIAKNIEVDDNITDEERDRLMEEFADEMCSDAGLREVSCYDELD